MPAAPAASASYEQWYNSGCAAAAAGDSTQSLHRLQESLDQCKKLLQEEGAGEEELHQEQAIIRWVMCCLNLICHSWPDVACATVCPLADELFKDE